MSYREYSGTKHFYRSEDSILFGVCGGIADYFDFNAWGVRFMLILIFILTGFFPVGIVYLIMAFMMKKAPVYYRSSFRDRG